MFEKFSKPASDILAIKAAFFDDNDAHRDLALRFNDVYKAQPERKNCKNCGTPINGADFTNFDVGYSICDECGHFNGMHEDTDEFHAKLYVSEGGADYAKNYLETDFNERVENI